MIDMESGNTESARDLKTDLINRSKRPSKEDTHIDTETVHAKRGRQKHRWVGKWN